jgi:hypothetical protein
MTIQRSIFDENTIDAKRAVQHAATRLHMGVFTNTLGMTEWRGANLGEPIPIYDPTGPLLFYDMPVLSTNYEQLGLVRASGMRTCN